MAKKETDIKGLQELKAAIRAKEPQNLYFFHGEETFLLHHYLEQLKKLLLDELTESFNYHRFTNENFEIREFADAVENLPMMAEHTLVQVDDVDIFKMSEDGRSKIAEILSDIPDYCTVVFTHMTVVWNPDKRLKKLWDVVQTKGNIVEFGKQEPKDLIPWITRHFASKGKRISSELCHYLMEITGGTMTALSGEIDKICAYSGAEHIQKADIDAVTEPVLDAVIYQITDAMGRGQYAVALEKLHQVLKMQEDPLKILGAIGGHFRRITTARTLQENGKQVGDYMKLCAITSSYAAQKTMDLSRRFSPEFCRKASELVLETDRKMKTSFDEPQRLLELLVLELAQEARRA